MNNNTHDFLKFAAACSVVLALALSIVLGGIIAKTIYPKPWGSYVEAAK